MVVDYNEIVSDDGVIEPGELLEIRSLRVRNNGGMWTPSMQPIIVYLENNNWIDFNFERDSYAITNSIQVN